MGSTIFSHFPASGGGSFIGNEDEIVTYDGEDWVKQSGLYASIYDKSLFESYPYYTFKLWNGDNGKFTIRDLIITDITDSEEVVIYDMQQDTGFSSISIEESASTPLYASGEFTLSTIPTNSITFSSLDYEDEIGNFKRYLAIKSSLFDPSRLYRIYVICDRTSVRLSFFKPKPTYSSNLIGTQLASAKYSSGVYNIIYNTPEVYTLIKSISSTNNGVPNSEFSIIGDNMVPLDNTHFLAMSGKTRFTMHDEAKMDLTHNANLYMHDDARFDMDGMSTMSMHEYANFSMSDSTRLHMHNTSELMLSGGAKFFMNGEQNLPDTNPEVVINDGSILWMAGDASGSPKVAFNGGCKFFMNGADDLQPSWGDPMLAISKTQFLYNGANDYVDVGTPDNATPWPFLFLESAKVMIGGKNYNDSRYATTFYPDNPQFTELRISSTRKAGTIVITNVIVTNLRTGEVVYDMSQAVGFSAISESSSPLFASGEFTLSTAPNTISFSAGQPVASKYLGIRSSLLPYDICSETGKNRYSIQVISNSSSPNSITLNAIYRDGQATRKLVNIPAVGQSTYTMPPMGIPASTWIKIGTEEGNVQVHILNNSFLQMAGNSHSEMHNDSFFIMKNRPENSVLETKAKDLYTLETGLLWANLTEEEKIPWYKKADNGHEKVEGSPFFQMVNNSSIDLDDGIDITGDSSGLYVNQDRVLTNLKNGTIEGIKTFQYGPASTVQELTFNEDISWSASEGNIANVVLTSDSTILNMENPIKGVRYTLVLTQDNVGNHTVTFESSYVFPKGTPELSTAANSIDILEFICLDGLTLTMITGSVQTSGTMTWNTLEE